MPEDMIVKAQPIEQGGQSVIDVVRSVEGQATTPPGAALSQAPQEHSADNTGDLSENLTEPVQEQVSGQSTPQKTSDVPAAAIVVAVIFFITLAGLAVFSQLSK